MAERNFEAEAPNRLWVRDTTEMLRVGGSKFFLAAVLDPCSRRCVGWAVSAVNDRHLTIRALEMAIRRRCPRLVCSITQIASTYASEDYRRLLERHGIACSMSRRGNCLDNVAMESSFSTVKFELGETCEWMHRGKKHLLDYVDFLQPEATALHARQYQPCGL